VAGVKWEADTAMITDTSSARSLTRNFTGAGLLQPVYQKYRWGQALPLRSASATLSLSSRPACLGAAESATRLSDTHARSYFTSQTGSPKLAYEIPVPSVQAPARVRLHFAETNFSESDCLPPAPPRLCCTLSAATLSARAARASA
jgi:hypothetical protein